MKFQDKVYFILVAPAVAGNIGAAARAIKTMGFKHLVLIRPKTDHLSDEAKMLAHGSHDILHNVIVYNSLEQALANVDFSIGTTAKNRTSKQEYYTCNQIRSLLEEKISMAKRVALVFGREESGLTNQELQVCDIASTIPLQTTFPSLNLGQAVMIYAYELNKTDPEIANRENDENKLAVLKNKTNSLLQNLEIDVNPTLYHRILERLALLNADDTNLMLSVLEKWQKKT